VDAKALFFVAREREREREAKIECIRKQSAEENV
jgi:hypothetical protein